MMAFGIALNEIKMMTMYERDQYKMMIHKTLEDKQQK